MSAPFINVTSYLGLIPILFGLIAAVWSCLIVIAGHYGVDLVSAVPLLHVEQGTKMPAPVFMVIVTAFIFVWGSKVGPRGYWFRIGAGGLLLAIFTTPYWLDLSMPVIWAVAACVIGVFTWRKLARQSGQ